MVSVQSAQNHLEWNPETGLRWNILGAVSSRYLPRRRLPLRHQSSSIHPIPPLSPAFHNSHFPSTSLTQNIKMRPQNVAGVAGTGALIMAAGVLADRAVFHVRPPVSETRPEQVQLTPFVLTSAHLSHRALH